MLTSQFVAAFIILNVNHSIWLLYFVNAFQSSILYNLIPYATSDFESHSLINVIYVVAASMSAATYIPLSKILDVFGRAEGFLLMLVFATLGLILMACSNGIAVFCAAYVSFKNRLQNRSRLRKTLISLPS